VIVGGFTAPSFGLPPNFTFHSLGKFEDYPVDRWSDALIKMLLELQYPVFALMLEDYWLTGPVKTDDVQVLTDYMAQFEYVARLDLTGDRLHSGFAKDYGQAGNVKLLGVRPRQPVPLQPDDGALAPERLLSILVAGESPWQIELEDEVRLRNLRNYRIVLGPPTRRSATPWPSGAVIRGNCCSTRSRKRTGRNASARIRCAIGRSHECRSLESAPGVRSPAMARGYGRHQRVWETGMAQAAAGERDIRG
jgi:hypothetical protein